MLIDPHQVARTIARSKEEMELEEESGSGRMDDRESEDLARQAFLLNHKEGNDISLEEAERYLEPTTSQGSKALTQMARLCHYVLLADERGTLDWLRSPDPVEVSDEHCHRYNKIIDFLNMYPDLRESDDPDFEGHLGGLLWLLSVDSLAQLGVLIEAARTLIHVERYRRFVLWNLDPSIPEPFRKQKIETERISPGAVATLLRDIHGPGYRMYEAALGFGLEEYEDDPSLKKLEDSHKALVEEMAKEAKKIELASLMHPVAYLHHLRITMERLETRFTKERDRIKKMYGIEQGNSQVDLSERDDAILQIAFIRRRFPKGRGTDYTYTKIAERLRLPIPPYDADKRCSTLFGAFKDFPWVSRSFCDENPQDEAKLGLVGDFTFVELVESAAKLEMAAFPHYKPPISPT